MSGDEVKVSKQYFPSNYFAIFHIEVDLNDQPGVQELKEGHKEVVLPD